MNKPTPTPRGRGRPRIDPKKEEQIRRRLLQGESLSSIRNDLEAGSSVIRIKAAMDQEEAAARRALLVRIAKWKPSSLSKQDASELIHRATGVKLEVTEF